MAVGATPMDTANRDSDGRDPSAGDSDGAVDPDARCESGDAGRTHRAFSPSPDRSPHSLVSAQLKRGRVPMKHAECTRSTCLKSSPPSPGPSWQLRLRVGVSIDSIVGPKPRGSLGLELPFLATLDFHVMILLVFLATLESGGFRRYLSKCYCCVGCGKDVAFGERLISTVHKGFCVATSPYEFSVHPLSFQWPHRLGRPQGIRVHPCHLTDS
mmetsp:Transcript_14426/g.39412  ORF Transcript_14426/g.39412 Transcript_14426/m.39412 type:complete len:213 (-) Transcript_14426:49-687(-)